MSVLCCTDGDSGRKYGFVKTSNLFVPAYRTVFGPDLPIVVLMRHPGAVVESFLRVKFPWAFDVDGLLQHSAFQEAFSVPLDRLKSYAGTSLGRLAVRWVVENAYLLKHSSQWGVHLLFYEDVIAEPATKIRALCQRLCVCRRR